jgi:peptide/nickel transport system permease protein
MSAITGDLTTKHDRVKPRRIRIPLSWRYVGGRLLGAIVAIWGAVTIVFFALQASGDPATLLLPLSAPPDQIEAFRAQFGLDQPLYVQYFVFLGHVITGSIPDSFRYGLPAMQVVVGRLGATLLLTSAGLGLGVVVGRIGGFFAATARTPFRRRVPLMIAIVFNAMPPVVIGILLVLFFALNLKWFPTGGIGTPAQLVLPAVTLAVLSAPTITRVYRASILASASDDHVRTARSKGVPENLVQIRHVGVNGLVPVVNVIGVISGSLLGGAVVAETIFSWPGIGQLTVAAISGRDYPVVLAGVLVIAVAFAGINLLVDIISAFLNPRISLT